MPATRTYKLGRHQIFACTGLSNDDIKDVTITEETSNEGNVTTRGSDADEEFVPIHKSTSFEVVSLHHALVMHSALQVTIGPKSGYTGTIKTGMYYVNSISEPQPYQDVIAHTIRFHRTVGN
jgi:hypothetical protein